MKKYPVSATLWAASAFVLIAWAFFISDFSVLVHPASKVKLTAFAFNILAAAISFPFGTITFVAEIICMQLISTYAGQTLLDPQVYGGSTAADKIILMSPGLLAILVQGWAYFFKYRRSVE